MSTRRDFIRKLAVGATVLKSSGAFASETEKKSNDKLLNVAIMGLGSYANRVAEAMLGCKKAKVAGVISGTPSKVSDWQKRFNIPQKNCYTYQNFDEIKNNPDIDAVYIITPNALHTEQTIRVARAGKHVLCEKPMATNAEEAVEMVNACRTANVKLLIGYRMHFEPKTLEVIRMRKSGEFGKVLFFEGLSGFRIGDPKQWRLNRELSGGGALMDIGIYSVNGSRYMIGEDPIWVTAQETKTDKMKFKEGIDETIQFQMGFPGGAVASCLSTYNMNNLDKFFLNGENGFAILQPSTGYGPIEGHTHLGKLNKPHVTHQTLQMDAMADIILNNTVPQVAIDGEEGLKDMKIIDAIYRAIATGSKVPLDL
jgi:predicted dehydrogenase